MKKLFVTLSLMVMTTAMMAVPAKKGLWKTLKLVDGTEVRATLVGDEFGHCWKSVDGKRYVRQDDAFVEQSAVAAQKANVRRAKAQQRRVARLPRRMANGVRRAPESHLGKKKGLILLVNFQDTKFQDENNQAFYNNVANTPGYTDENGFQGSVADYFKDQSRGQFELTFDVVGPVTVSKKASYYGENDAYDNDLHPEEMVAEAVTLAKSLVTDWKQYDWDGDGEVDQVMIIYAGEGEADGGDASTIWPHEFQLQYEDEGHVYGERVEVGTNLYVNTYAVANEGSQQDFFGLEYFAVNGIGTICHEFSHCLGLMDMYDTSYSGFYGMGEWSLMDQGSYNGDGFIPSGYSSYDRYAIGWITPTMLTADQSVANMRALADADDVYMIQNAAHPDEYYLLENRQQKGWDEKLPSKGMLVLHIDYDKDIWDYNLANSRSDGTYGPVNDHERCTIFHADGVDQTGAILDKLDREGDTMSDDEYDALVDQYYADIENDVYPLGSTELSNTSKPRAFLYNNNTDGRKLMNIKISDITQNADGTIAFNFAQDTTGDEEGDNTEYGQTSGGGGGTVATLPFKETFDQCSGKGGNDGSWSGSIATAALDEADLDHAGWTYEKGFAASKCAKFGTTSVAGSATTPAIALDGTATLTFQAGAWNAKNDGTALNLSVEGGTVDPSSVTMTKGAFGNFTATVTGTGNVRITFAAQAGRFFLDEVSLVADATAIRDVPAAVRGESAGIYTLDGRLVGTSYDALPRGLYIMNGKKVIK